MPTPKPDIKGIKKFHEYRYEKKLEYRDIKTLMKKDLKTLARWNSYIKEGILNNNALGKLSTGKKLTVGK